jgi:hypothetical protein
VKRFALFFLLVVGCGTPAAPPPATVQSVSMRTSDLPNGLVVCGLSGDIDTFLKGAPANNQYASQLQSDWTTLKAQGAQKGYVRVFARSEADCKNAFTASTSTPMPLVAAMVVQFKNTAAAAKAYVQADVQQSQIASLPGAQQGAGTGLSKNSLTFGDAEGTQSIFFGYWQNGRFLALVLAVDVGTKPALKAAEHVNSRIH